MPFKKKADTEIDKETEKMNIPEIEVEHEGSQPEQETED